MKIAIMQPYFFPYSGYFKLVGSVDKFVFYDDVNFIKNGWINRNKLLSSGRASYFTVPLSGASSYIKICHVGVQDRTLWKRKLLELVRHSYTKAPNFVPVFDMFQEVLNSDYEGVAELARNSIITISQRLGFSTHFIATSAGYGNGHLAGVHRVIDICHVEQAKEYINLPGGRDLYEQAIFCKNGIKLKFLEGGSREYKQFDNEFVPGLSILDILMFNSFDSARALLIEE